MFGNCWKLSKEDLPSFNIKKSTNFNNMFSICWENLTDDNKKFGIII